MSNEPSGISIVSPKIRDQSITRKFVGLNGTGYVALDIKSTSGSVDPDENSLGLKVWFNDVLAQQPVSDDPRGVLVATIGPDEITREDVGKYYYDIGPQYTKNRGTLAIEWSYRVNGTDFTFQDNLQIQDQMPLYDSLSDDQRLMVEQVTYMYGDLFDSTEGGPYLIEPFQTHYDYERIAQIAQMAITRINLTGFPVVDWGIGPGTATAPKNFNGLITMGTYYEVMRHLIRSYVEIPVRANMQVTYLDRTAYSQRWQAILSSEWPQFESMIKMAKRSLLQLGRGSLLVSGGIFGGGANGLFMAGGYAAMTRAFRFYPAAPAVSFPAGTGRW